MATFQDLQDLINKAINDFDRGIPGLQRELLDLVTSELRNLDLKPGGTIEINVKNIRLLSKIKGQLSGIILNDDYIEHVKQFADAFVEVANIQNIYWKQVENTFKPTALLDEIKKQSISATIDSLTESGISGNVSELISDILQTNIGSGGSIKQLEQQLRDALTSSNSSDGALQRYTKQITTDSINQFSANYTKIVSDDLGYEWYGYRGSDIRTTRPFCDAMTDFRYFHVSEVPGLLKAEHLGGPLLYMNKKTQQMEQVPIYSKTGLPQGMYDGENATTFFIQRGGYNCGHQLGPVSEMIVPEPIRIEVYSTPTYRAWAILHPNSRSAKKNFAP